MGTTTIYRYQCPCGSIGTYSKHSSDWFFGMIGAEESGPPKCLRCGKIICNSCSKGSYCLQCAEEVPGGLKFLIGFIKCIKWLLLIACSLCFIVLIRGGIEIGLYFVIFLVSYIFTLALQFIVKARITHTKKKTSISAINTLANLKQSYTTDQRGVHSISAQKLIQHTSKINAELFENLEYLDLLSEYWKLNFGSKYLNTNITFIFHFIRNVSDENSDLTVYFKIDRIRLESHVFHGGTPKFNYPNSVIFSGLNDEFQKENSTAAFIYNVANSEKETIQLLFRDFLILVAAVIERKENGITPTQDVMQTIKIDKTSPIYSIHVPQYLQHPERFHPQFDSKLPGLQSDVANKSLEEVGGQWAELGDQNLDPNLLIRKYIKRIRESAIFDKKINLFDMLKITHGFIQLLMQNPVRIPTLYLSISQITDDLINKGLVDPSLPPPHRTTRGNALFQIIFDEFGVFFWINFMKIPLPRESNLYINPDLAIDVFNEASFTVGSRPK